jgi:hypothetical protein
MRMGEWSTMMEMSRIQPLVTEVDLEQQGFDPAAVAKIKALAACYPWIEFVDSDEEFRRLVFLKWRHTAGRMRD